MFVATDTDFAPWYVVKSDAKMRARLNLISHLLSKVPNEAVPREKVSLSPRQKARDDEEPDYPFKFVPEKF
jgi:polyphosphate kinase